MADPKLLENLNIPGVGPLVVSDASAVKGAGISAATSVQNNDTTVPTGKAVTTELNKKQNTLTAGTGLAFGTGADANKLGHSNSVTAKTSSSVKKFTYDANGHVTGSSELSTAESNALASGIDSTKVGQIATNTTNIGKVQTQANWNTNNGVKNLFNPTFTTTVNPSNFTGTVTRNANNSYTINGTNGSSVSYITLGYITLGQGDYVIYGRPDNNAGLYLYDDGTWIDSDNYDRRYISITETTTKRIYLRIAENTSLSNYTVYPMICTKAAWDISHDFQPYALPNPTLTQGVIWNTNNGVKNLLDVDKLYTSNSNGVTYTLNSDGSITANGTATSLSYITLGYNNSEIRVDDFCNGNYVLSGCPSGGDFSTGYSLYAAKGNYTRIDTGSGVLLTSTSETDVKVVIRVASGVTINKTFKPMIRPAFIEDDTFEPYSLPNTKITPELIELVDSGAKNLIPVTRDEIKSYNAWSWNGYTATNGGITFTLNEDMSITMNGTCTSTVELTLMPRSANRSMFKSAGTYELQCKVPSGSSWFVGVNRTVSGSGVRWGVDSGSGLEFTVAGSDVGASNGIWIGITQGVQINNVTVYPMVCTKAAWDVSQKFVPYRPTYEETVEQVATNKNNILSKIGASDYATQNTGGTVRVWTTTSGGETTLHIANEATTP